MGNGICNCSGPSKKGQEELLEAEEKKKHTASKQPSPSSALSKDSSNNEECNEAPIKQNKKPENKISRDSNDDDDDLPDIPNINSNDDSNNGVPDETINYNDYVLSSTHNITKIMDIDAAKAHKNDDDEDDEDDDESSISNLSEGFDENGITIDFKPKKKKSEHKDLLRFRSKAKWDTGALDDHEADMLAEMRRLSISQGTRPSNQ